MADLTADAIPRWRLPTFFGRDLIGSHRWNGEDMEIFSALTALTALWVSLFILLRDKGKIQVSAHLGVVAQCGGKEIFLGTKGLNVEETESYGFTFPKMTDRHGITRVQNTDVNFTAVNTGRRPVTITLWTIAVATPDRYKYREVIVNMKKQVQEGVPRTLGESHFISFNLKVRDLMNLLDLTEIPRIVEFRVRDSTEKEWLLPHDETVDIVRRLNENYLGIDLGEVFGEKTQG